VNLTSSLQTVKAKVVRLGDQMVSVASVQIAADLTAPELGIGRLPRNPGIDPYQNCAFSCGVLSESASYISFAHFLVQLKD
jgi:hypothetical protein